MKFQSSAVLLIAIALSAAAQTERIPDPDFNNVPSLYDPASKKYVELERSPMNSAARATGYGKAESLVFREGTSSPVKVKANGSQKFILKVDAKGVDPYTIADLNRWQVNVKQERREYIAAKANAFRGTQTQNIVVPIKYKKIGEGLYEIEFERTPGEYFFSTSTPGNFLYSFKVVE